MTLVALTVKSEIANAYGRFCKHFEIECDVLERTVGFQGGSEPATVRWFPPLGFWARLYPQNQGNGYWCGFGIDNPLNINDLSFTCEINPPYAGVDKLRAALFVRSNNGTIYLAHSGGVAGGRSGVGKAKFLKFYGSETVDDVYWPDKSITEHIIIGALDDDEFLGLLSEFVHKVAEFKALPKGG